MLDQVKDAGAWASSGGLYVTGEDHLRLTTIGALAGAVVALEGRLVSPTGVVTPIAERHVPTSNYTATSTIYPLAEGLLTHAQLRVTTGTAVRGHIFGVLELVRGREGGVQPLATLLSDYITATGRLAWPGSPIASSVSGAGRLRTIVGTDPAANTEVVELVPAGARWKLRTFNVSLVASAAVANRIVLLTVDDGANVLWQCAANVAQTAGQTNTYRAGTGVQLTTITGQNFLLPLPTELALAAGSRIRTVTVGLDVGDNYVAPIYQVEEYLEG